MSEPTPSARVALITTLGNIEIEVWAKEMPLAARNFITQCHAGVYDGTYFHRIASTFVQAGPENVETIYGKPFDLETNGRIRMNRRGIVGCAGTAAGQTSQLIFTTCPAPELAAQCTAFGRLVGDSVYVLAAINDAEKDGEAPVHPVRIDRADVQVPFFELAATEQPKPQVPTRPKRQIRVFDDEDAPPLVLKKNPRLGSAPSPALEAVKRFEAQLDEFVAKNKLRG